AHRARTAHTAQPGGVPRAAVAWRLLSAEVAATRRLHMHDRFPRSILRNALIALCLASSGAKAGIYADLTNDWTNNNQQVFPAQDANNFTKDELMASILGLYWGDFDGARTAQHRMRREDGTNPNLYSQYVGWIPYRALIREREAIRVGLDAVITKLRNPASYHCVGLERGGGFLV